MAAAGTAALMVGAASAAGAALRDPHRRKRVERSARVWWLTTRRGAHWATVKVRGVGADEARKAELEQRFAIRSAEDVAAALGNMKGAIMKLGQLVSFIAEGLPPEAQQALASLQADVEPMAPSLAEQVVREELGDDPEHLFLDWSPVPVAAASVGQVHRAVLHDGRVVAVKVQYPGVGRAIMSDLDNAEVLYSMASAISLKGLDVKGFVDELRVRMGEELDYRREAANQAEFAALYRDHPFIHVPDVVPEHSAERVITTEWADGLTWAQFETTASPAVKQRAGEVLFRFAQGLGAPPRRVQRRSPSGQLPLPRRRLHHLPRLRAGEAVVAGRVGAPVALPRRHPRPRAGPAGRARWSRVASSPRITGSPRTRCSSTSSAPYVPYLTERFTFSRSFTADALSKVFDVNGPSADVIRKLNMPPSFVILDRVVWGVSALLGKLGAEGPWRGILAEYRYGGPPVTELGRQDAEWRAGFGRGAGR